MANMISESELEEEVIDLNRRELRKEDTEEEKMQLNDYVGQIIKYLKAGLPALPVKAGIDCWYKYTENEY